MIVSVGYTCQESLKTSTHHRAKTWLASNLFVGCIVLCALWYTLGFMIKWAWYCSSCRSTTRTWPPSRLMPSCKPRTSFQMANMCICCATYSLLSIALVLAVEALQWWGHETLCGSHEAGCHLGKFPHPLEAHQEHQTLPDPFRSSPPPYGIYIQLGLGLWYFEGPGVWGLHDSVGSGYSRIRDRVSIS